ncbi:glycosyltransferase [Leuconostoc citreum]|uniref:glycosyltransferase n=1 Tax=Leuconostoc citreum TaxID=33964 RepID=UPI0011BB04AC|nr:glycosyltransferase [Leuconostoc citreum]QEA36652.1 glycosyltransferase [Leuconostoc citreum]QGN60425.1 glycosyltransferase [Leuconostoc citreum]
MVSYVAGIVTYNRFDKLLSAIDSLLSQTVLPTSIIVVDNASTDIKYKTLQELFKFSSVPVLIKKQKNNLGGSGGFAQLFNEVQQFTDDFLLLSDDDVVYNHDYAEQLLKHISGEKTIYVGRAVDIRGVTLAQHYPVKFQGELSHIKTITFLGVLLPIIAIKEVGLPIADFFIWEDDREYAQRLVKKGKYHFVGINNAIVLHDSGPNNLGRLKSDWRTYYGIRNFIYRVSIHENNIYGWTCVIWKLAKSVGITILMPNRYRGNFRYRFGQIFNGTVDGINGNLGINEKYFPGKRKL